MEREMENNLASFSFYDDDDEGEEFVLKDSDKDSLEGSIHLRLLGKLLTNKAVNFGAFRDRMAELWRSGKGVHISEPWPQLYLFQFVHPLDVEYVMETRPWSFDNNLLLLHMFKTGDIPHEITFPTVDFWVHIHDLPVSYMSESVGHQLGDFIGNYIDFDPRNLSGIGMAYMRIRVVVFVDRPLKRWKKMRREAGESFKVSFKYERLPIFCFLCDLLGHNDKFCSKRFATFEQLTTLGWGHWLRAPTRRTTPSFGSKWLVRANGTSGPEEEDGGSVREGSYQSDKEGDVFPDFLGYETITIFAQANPHSINFPNSSRFPSQAGNSFPHDNIVLGHNQDLVDLRRAQSNEEVDLVLADDKKRKKLEAHQ